MRSGEPTNGALVAKLKLCEKLMILTSASGAGHKSGKSGSIVIATHTSEWRGRNWTVHEFGKGGTSGDEWREEGQYYRTQSFYRGGRRGGEKGGKGGGK